ncbi:E3 ubiquitin-protein ligase RNF217-like [Ostrea edulis]|uniref:E3 ubiquitin-protein ligase RNF217-like n=1 Tax=Ostrea edulis TaxID=37623 RepID=UPI00209566E0|nr:E3 ubiquitin-protein ligase RNF217-like [Ostrea edulis]
MQYQRLSEDYPAHLSPACTSILDVKKKIAPRYGVSHYSLSIVDFEEGILYEDGRQISGLSSPLQVMVGNENRQFPSYLKTEEPDMLTLDDSDDEPRLRMSCGHAISADSLFGYTKSELMTNIVDEIRCPTEGCNFKWSMQEIVRKSDMTDDERIFFEYRISMNAVNKDDDSTSTCPECGNYCQRQAEDNKQVNCVFCSKSTGKDFNFCWECKSLWFPNHSCANVELEAFQRILNEAPLKMLDYSHIEGVPSKRMCPSCRTLIEHESMCKEMTCIKCKFKFCFSCLTPCLNGSLQCSGYNRKCSVAKVQNVFQ